MTLMEYQEAAQRTSNTKNSGSKIFNALFGLPGEVGELCDYEKKFLYQGHDYDFDHMIEEAGDVLWYLAELAVGLGTTLEEIAQRNIDKLKKRYPNGFEAERSLHREEGAGHD